MLRLARFGLCTLAIAVWLPGCKGESKRIRQEFAAWLARQAPLPRSSCPRRAEKVARIQKLVPLVLQAHRAIRQFERPVRAELRETLVRTPLLGLATDYRCLMRTLRERQKSEIHYFVALGTLANLYLRKAEILLSMGRQAGGYQHVLAALELYALPSADGFIYYLGLAYFLTRIKELFDRYPPSRSVVEQVQFRVYSTEMPRALFCRGLREEILFHAAVHFYEHLKPHRERLLSRWGADAVGRIPGLKSGLSGDAWDAFVNVFNVVWHGCESRLLKKLSDESRKVLIALKRTDVGLAGIMDVVIGRLERFSQLDDTQLGMRVELAARRRGAADAKAWKAIDREHLDHAYSPWSGAKGKLVPEKGQMVLRRGQFHWRLGPVGKVSAPAGRRGP